MVPETTCPEVQVGAIDTHKELESLYPTAHVEHEEPVYPVVQVAHEEPL